MEFFGGEYPIPVPGLSAGQIQVTYKQYGVSLAFTPTVLNGNLINLKIIPGIDGTPETLTNSVPGATWSDLANTNNPVMIAPSQNNACVFYRLESP